MYTQIRVLPHHRCDPANTMVHRKYLKIHKKTVEKYTKVSNFIPVVYVWKPCPERFISAHKVESWIQANITFSSGVSSLLILSNYIIEIYFKETLYVYIANTNCSKWLTFIRFTWAKRNWIVTITTNTTHIFYTFESISWLWTTVVHSWYAAFDKIASFQRIKCFHQF